MSVVIYIEIFIYLAAMLGIGLYYGKKNISHNDYFIGGGKLPGWVLSLSERATAESAYMFLGAVGFIYVSGYSGIWILSGMFLGVVVSWIFLSKKFMNAQQEYKVNSLTEFIAVRFPKHADIIRWLSSFVILLFFVCYLAAQFSGIGKTIYTFSGISINTGTIIIAVIIILYSSTGGFMSVAWTDAIQSILMLIAFIIVPIAAFLKIQNLGLDINSEIANSVDNGNKWLGGLTGLTLGAMLLTNLSWFFGWLGGQPQLSVRFMAFTSEKELRYSRNIALVWTFIVYIGAFLSAIFAIVLFKKSDVGDPEMVLPYMVEELLPPWVVGIILAAILAAIMSTASSQLLVITTSISEDIIHNALKVKISSNKLVWLSRIITLISGIAGIIISLKSGSVIYNLVSFAWSGVGNTFSVVILLMFFWKKFSGVAAIIVIFTGFVSAILWSISPLEGIISAKIATFFICLVSGIIFSLIFPDENNKNLNAL